MSSSLDMADNKYARTIEHEISGSGSTQDAIALGRAGKKQVLKRNFGFMSILAFSFLVISTWLGPFLFLGINLVNGGPAGTLYAFIAVWIGDLACFTSLAELASMAPTSGGQYHWVSILAPRSSQALWSFTTGWLTVCGWQAAVASGVYVIGLLFQALIELVDASYTPQLWHVTLLLYASLILCVFVTTVLGPVFPMIENFLLVFYICAFIGIIVPIAYLPAHRDPTFMFTTFVNEGGWSSQGLSVFVGISGTAFAFLGADAIYHMSEEVKNSATVVPKAMIWAIIVNGVLGFAMYLAVMASIDDLDSVLSTTYSFAFLEILIQVTQSVPATVVILVVLTIIDISLVISTLASASRMLWSFSRDKGIPGWRWVMQVDPKTTIPSRAVLVTACISVLLGLISTGSPVVFNDIVSLTVNSLYASYFMACALLLWRRLQGSILEPSDQLASVAVAATDDGVNHRRDSLNVAGSEGKLVWGPWRVREPWGTIVNIVACAYLITVFIFTFFPPATPVTPATMNYSVLVMGFVAIVSAVYFIIWGHKTYKGPVVDFET